MEGGAVPDLDTGAPQDMVCMTQHRLERKSLEHMVRRSVGLHLKLSPARKQMADLMAQGSPYQPDMACKILYH